MSTLGVMTKAPSDVLDYDIGFEKWLPDGDSIVSASADIEGDPGTIVIDRVTFSDTAAKVWLSGGTDGQSVEIAVVGTTNGGRTKKSCFRLRIKDCC